MQLSPGSLLMQEARWKWWGINAPKNSFSANDGCELEDKYSSFLAPGAVKENKSEALLYPVLQFPSRIDPQLSSALAR